ncbi:MAG: ribonuclease HII [Anaerolineales bacterium]
MPKKGSTPKQKESPVPAWPTLEFETQLWAAGLVYVAGIDEVGRGALAGPVYAAAVILPIRDHIHHELQGVRDSKQMSSEEREFWAPIIREKAVAFALGRATSKEIDRYGIVPATHLAARRALRSLAQAPQHLLLDYITLQKVSLPQTAMVAGDARCLSIAAASVVAKVARDAELTRFDRRFPGYGFASHKGYATDEHFEAIRTLGPCAQHRLSWVPFSPSA